MGPVEGGAYCGNCCCCWNCVGGGPYMFGFIAVSVSALRAASQSEHIKNLLTTFTHNTQIISSKFAFPLPFPFPFRTNLAIEDVAVLGGYYCALNCSFYWAGRTGNCSL